MIELRWFDREVKDLPSYFNIANGRPRETVLQWRDGNYHDMLRATGEPVWRGSDWTDVPTVRESLSMAELQARMSAQNTSYSHDPAQAFPSSRNPYGATET